MNINPYKRPNILQILKERITEKYPHIKQEHVEQVVDFQWKSLYKEFSNKENATIEVTGLGTFNTKPKKAEKALEDLGMTVDRIKKKAQDKGWSEEHLSKKLGRMYEIADFLVFKLNKIKNQTNE